MVGDGKVKSMFGGGSWKKNMKIYIFWIKHMFGIRLKDIEILYRHYRKKTSQTCFSDHLY